jgi:hypothetical protein
VEPFTAEGSESALVEEEDVGSVDHLWFVGETRLLAVFSNLRVALIDWKEDRVIDETSLAFRSGGTSSTSFEPQTGLLMADGRTDGKQIIEVDPDEGFRGQHMLPDTASRSGLLTAQSGGKKFVMWTVDQRDNKMRMYALADLRRGMSVEEVQELGSLMPPGELVEIDRQGSRYISDGGRLTVMRGTQTATIEHRGTVVPSWDGRRVLTLGFDPNTSKLMATVHDGATLEEQWSLPPVDRLTGVAWSRDDKHLAVSTDSGAVILDAATGERVGARCGLEFEARGAPPRRESRSSGPSICDE